MIGEETEARKACDLSIAKLEKPRQTGKVPAAKAKVDADVLRGLHPNRDIFAYLVTDLSAGIGDGGAYATFLEIDTTDGIALQKLGISGDPAERSEHERNRVWMHGVTIMAMNAACSEESAKGTTSHTRINGTIKRNDPS